MAQMLNAAAEFAFNQVGMTHRFVVRIDRTSFDLGTWSKAAGLTVSWAKCDYRPGENNDLVLIPGNVSYSNIKLARAACSDSATVQKWLANTSKQHEPLSGAIYMIDFVGIPVITWELKQFFPISWSIDEFSSTAAKPALETLELAHSGFLHDEARLGLA